MNTIRLTLLSVLVLGTMAMAGEAPVRKEVHAQQQWYKDTKGEEKEFVGVLQKLEEPMATSGRFNAYRLQVGEKEVYEVYAPAGDLLKPLIGKKVRIKGKRVDMNVEMQAHRELWPAWIELAE